MAQTNRFDVTAEIVKKGLNTANHTFTATASSTRRDRGGHAFSISCIQTMAKDMPGRTLFYHHQYRPEDAIGMIESAVVLDKGTHHELVITARLDVGSARGAEIERQLSEGLRLALSVGVILKSVEQKTIDGEKTMLVTACESLEISVTGIGSNKEADWLTKALGAASAWAEDRASGRKVAAAGDAVAALRTLVALQKVQIAIQAAELRKHEEATDALCRQVDILMKTPVGRKIRPEVAAHFVDLQARYPWLDSTIIDSLARDGMGSRS